MFSLSGQVAGGLQTALDEVMERRLREQLRRQQEQQQAAELQMRRDEMAARAADRKADLAYRDGQVARADASDIMRDTAPGPISEETAGILRKVPAGQARLSSRKILEGVRPIGAPSVLPGAMAQPSGLTGGVDRSSRMGGESAMADAGGGMMDASGPQGYSVLNPTQEQAEGQYRKRRLIDLGTLFKKGGMGEAQRRQIQGEAFGEGIAVPESLVGQTGEEKTAQEMAGEKRDQDWWRETNKITSGQADARQSRSDVLMRGRAEDARDDKPPTSAQSTLAGYAARVEQSNPQISSLESHIKGMNTVSFETQIWADRPSLQSKEMQQYMQASRNFINAVLRRESGAVINPDEFATARQQYLPIPGDDETALKMKRANRALVQATFK